MQTIDQLRAKILSASAGSGKTYQLAYKYVHDVIEHPELFRSILAVTFTNKATEEMKSRILHEIDTLASGKKSPYMDDLCKELMLNEQQIRKRALRARTLILHNYSRFSVLTIDKFFQRIIRAFIKELGIDLNYNIELDPSQLLARGADNLVNKIAKNEELRKWLLEFAEERLTNGYRWDMRGDLRQLGSELFKEGCRDRMKMQKSKAELDAIVSNARESAKAATEELMNHAQTMVKIMEQHGVMPEMFKGSSRSFTFKFQKYATGDISEPTATMLKAANDVNEWYGQSASANVRAAALELQPLLAKLCDIYYSSIRHCNTAKLLSNNYRSYALLSDLYNELTLICDAENIMILGETKHILSTFVDGSNAPFIYEKVGNRYERFMIDEFQDTSVREWSNMLPLLQNAMASSDKCSVLIVGDVKQSIYRWRGGDWRLLHERAKVDLGPENVFTKPLEHNYRSLENIIEFNNEMISNVVDIDNNYLNKLLDKALKENKISPALHSSLHGIVKLAYNKHKQIPGHKHSDKGFAELTLYDSKLIDSPFIEAIEDAISRGYRYRDILILVRGATDGKKVTEQLFKYKEQHFTSRGEVGFNVLTADSLTIENNDVVNFIIANMRLAVDVKNHIERGVYLRFLGIQYDHQFTDDECAFFAKIAHLSPLEAFEQIVARHALSDRHDAIAYLQAIHEGIYSFTTSRVADIQHYLKWWDEHGHTATLSVDMTDDTIEISTIHKAKGLERPVVIIPYCKWDTTPAASLQPIVWSKVSEGELSEIGEFPVTFGNTMQNSHFTDDYYNELVMSHVDGVNLLYVAMTRAANELYMFVPTRLNTKSSSDAINNIVPLLSTAVNNIISNPEIYNGTDGVERKVYSYGEKLACGTATSKSKKRERSIILTNYESHTPEVQIRYPSRRFTEEGLQGKNLRHKGLRLHKLFEESLTIEDLRTKLDQMVVQSLIDHDEAQQLKSAIDKAMSTEIVAEWFTDCWDDVKIEADIISSSTSRRPDRVMIRGGHAVVVDYKFGENVNSAYTRQVAEYMRLLEGMGLYSNIEGYVWYISLGKVVKV